MNSYTLHTLFEKYSGIIPKSMENGRVLKLTFYEQQNKMSVAVKFDELQGFDLLSECENKLAQAIGIDRFEILCKYTPDMLGSDYFGELVKFMKSRFPVVNGFFDGATAVYDSGSFTVNLLHGGESVLKKAGIESQFSALVYEMFSVSAGIAFTGVTENDEEAFYKAQEEFLQSIPVNIPYSQSPEQGGPSGSHSGVSDKKIDFRTCSVDFTRLHLIAEDAVVLKGAPISSDSKVTDMKNIPLEGMDEPITVWGEVFQVDTRETRNGMLIAIIYFTDFTSSFSIKMLGGIKRGRSSKMLSKEELEAILEKLKKGACIICSGKVEVDDYDHKTNLTPDSIMLVKREKLTDSAEKKRVELHCHTNMSSMDALTSADKLVNRAFEWGHQAIAITDHGVVQGYPDAMNAVAKIRKGGGNFKAIYGIEAYEVNNDVNVFKGWDKRRLTDEIIVFDLETTGTSATNDRIIEIGAVKLRNLEISERFDMLVNPGRELTDFISNLTHITLSLIHI